MVKLDAGGGGSAYRIPVIAKAVP